jgi:cystathionine beta-lyase/cystathionine gamma-synthase
MTEAQRRARGITSNFFRLSVGFEDSQDIIQALDDALSAI